MRPQRLFKSNRGDLHSLARLIATPLGTTESLHPARSLSNADSPAQSPVLAPLTMVSNGEWDRSLHRDCTASSSNCQRKMPAFWLAFSETRL